MKIAHEKLMKGLQIKKIGIWIIFMLLIAYSAAAQTESVRKHEIWLSIELLIFVAFAAAIILNIQLIRLFGKSVFGVLFVYVLMGTVLMGMTRFLYLLYEFNLSKVSDDTHEFWWHLIFYIGMISFLIALKKIRGIESGKLERYSKADTAYLVLLVLLAILVILVEEPLNSAFSSWFSESIADRFGLQHFIAFSFAGLLAAKLHYLKINFGIKTKKFIAPFFLFLLLLSLNHFWELLTESWGIINLSEQAIETIEQFFWFPAFAVLAYGMNNMLKDSKKSLKIGEK